LENGRAAPDGISINFCEIFDNKVIGFKIDGSKNLENRAAST